MDTEFNRIELEMKLGDFFGNKENKQKIKLYNKEFNKIKNQEEIEDNQTNGMSILEYKKFIKEKEFKIQKRKDYCNAYYKPYVKEKRKTDPGFKLSGNIRRLLLQSLKNQGYSKKTKTYNILKCHFSFFMEWLNGVASNGYTYGIGDLNLDHVVPISLAQTEDELLLLSHYSNFQLLTAFENVSKGNRYVNPVNLARVLEHHPNPDKIREIHSRL
jgi:hypothetical protein